jgi:hypothetical protein
MSLGSHRALLAAAGAGGGAEDFEALLSTTVGSNASTVTLTSAGSAKAWTEFQDLFLISSCRETTGGTGNGGVECRLNAASTTYRIEYMWGTGSSGSYSTTALRENNTGARLDWCTRDGTHADEYGTSVATIADINSNRYKTVLNQGGVDVNGTGTSGLIITTWENTAAVTSLEMRPSSWAQFKPGTRFDLYGIRAAA